MWRAGDLVVWDNHATLHAATRLADAVAHERVMWRTTMLDDGGEEDPESAAALRERVLSSGAEQRRGGVELGVELGVDLEAGACIAA